MGLLHRPDQRSLQASAVPDAESGQQRKMGIDGCRIPSGTLLPYRRQAKTIIVHHPADVARLSDHVHHGRGQRVCEEPATRRVLRLAGVQRVPTVRNGVRVGHPQQGTVQVPAPLVLAQQDADLLLDLRCIQPQSE